MSSTVPIVCPHCGKELMVAVTTAREELPRPPEPTSPKHGDMVKSIMKNLQNKTLTGAPLEDIVRAAETKGIKERDVKSIIDKMKTDGTAFEPQKRYFKLL